MNVRNCKKCGKIYNYVLGPNICPTCRETMEARFQDVKSYIFDNRRSGIQEISEACDIEIAQIQQWIREERLVFSDDSPISIGCEVCGAMIKTGRFCQKCKNEMASSLGGAMKPTQTLNNSKGKDTKDAPKMRFLDRT